MTFFNSKGVVERLEAALKRAETAHRPQIVLSDAIIKEIATIKAIKDMPGFRAWIEGERFDLSKAKGRK
jgi:hypothetical protein